MVQIKPKFQSFEDYLSYDDGTENLYELYNGELLKMPPESGKNIEIATFLLIHFAALLGYRRVRGQGLELEVRGEPRNRYPDLTILREEHIKQLEKRNTIRLFMSPPLLVVEVVSQGELQRHRDYIAKRLQYQDCGIPEYWIVDPQVETVLVLTLTDKIYTEFGQFSGEDLIISPQFNFLKLSVSELFKTNSH
jgi:Uma2 family endonuclease